MSRMNRIAWQVGNAVGAKRTSRRNARRGPLDRALRVEPLEDRRLLSITVNTLVDEADGSIVDGDISLRDAITLAPSGETIDFAPSLTSGGPAMINLTVGTLNSNRHLTINKNLRVNGPGADFLTIKAYDPDANGANDGDGSRVFNVDDGSGAFINVEIIGLTLTGGDVALGGAIRNFEKLTVSGATITANSATQHGGGIYNQIGTLAVIDSRILNNSAGMDGGGIETVVASLTTNRSTISGNSAGRVGGGIDSFNNNSLSVTDSTISNNSASDGGGGIYGRNGMLMVTSSTISGNRATRGGGIMCLEITMNTPDEKFTLIDSRIIENTATSHGGGVFTDFSVAMITRSTISGNSSVGPGGGIHNRRSSLTLTDSAVVANSANEGGGISSYTNDGSFLNESTTISGSTISGNSATLRGGGVSASGITVIRHSTITTNSAPSGSGSGVASFGVSYTLTKVQSSIIAGNANSDVDFVAGNGSNSFQSDGYNLIGTGNALTTFNQAGDQTGVANPLLGPLAENGGPSVTHALLSGSPAIDAGDPAAMGDVGTVPAFDQRGVPFFRVVGPAIDIGAYERSLQPIIFVVDILLDESDGDFSTNDLSLREAIERANNHVGVADTIIFDPQLTVSSPAHIRLTLGELLITDPVTITGPGANLLRIDAGGRSRIFNIDNERDFSIDVEIIGLTLTNGSVLPGTATVSHSGGAILTKEKLTVVNSTISGNSAIWGGGIANNFENLTVSGSTVSGNSALSDGGGLYSISSLHGLTVVDSTISGNSASRGGGIFSRGGGIFSNTDIHPPALTMIVGSTISGNTATDRGGGIYNREGPTAIRHSTITKNSAPSGSGSGVASLGVTYTRTEIQSTIIAGNANSDVDFIAGNGSNSFQSDGYNLIGSGNALGAFTNADQTGVTIPRLGPLADNGGPTMTHALLVGSPAINAGDPAAMAGMNDVPEFDQRGSFYTRIVGGRIDMGAIERQPQPADFDNDGDADGFDFLAWQRGFGTLAPNAAKSEGDADNDDDVDGDDFAVWAATFGAQGGAVISSVSARTALSPAAVDATLAYQQLLAVVAPRRSVRSRLMRVR